MDLDEVIILRFSLLQQFNCMIDTSIIEGRHNQLERLPVPLFGRRRGGQSKQHLHHRHLKGGGGTRC